MRADRWIKALALFLPLLILGATWAALIRPSTGALTPEAAAVSQDLAADPPDILLVGNSLVEAGVLPERLSEILEEGTGAPAEVSMLYAYSTRPPNWYVLLKNRVFGEGHRPRLILVVATARMHLTPSPTSPIAWSHLAAHSLDVEPVIDRKTFQREVSSRSSWSRAMENRGRLQDALQRGVRDAVAGLLFGGEGGLLSRGEAVATPALEQVFSAEGAVDIGLHHRVVPVAQEGGEDVSEVPDIRSIQDTLIPDLIDLARENDTPIAFVWIPIASLREDLGMITPEQEAELLRLLNDGGAGWLDLHAADIPDTGFRDLTHMNPSGAEIFTELLGDAVLEVGALGGGPMKKASALDPAEILASRGPSRLSLVSPNARKKAIFEVIPFLHRIEALVSSIEGEALARWAAPEWSWLADDAVHARTPCVGCSPLVILEDGEPLDHRKRCGKDQRHGDGWFCSAEDYFLISARGGVSALQSGREYTLGLTTERAARGGMWFYPGDQALFPIRGALRKKIKAPIRALQIRGTAFPEGRGGEVEILARGGGQLRLQALVPVSQLIAGEVELAFSEPLPEGVSLEVTLRLPEDGPFLLLNRLSVSE